VRSPFHLRDSAFGLVEVLVVAATMVATIGFMLTVADQTSRIMRSTTGKVEQFRGARAGFGRMAAATT